MFRHFDRYTDDRVRRDQTLLGAAGLRPLRFHDLRHDAASLLLAQGVHPRVVMIVLGPRPSR